MNNNSKNISNTQLISVENVATTSAPLTEDTEMPDVDRGFIQYDMARNVEETARAAEEIRPAATRKAYQSKAREFETWAKETFTHEPLEQRAIVSPEKVNYFLRTKVVGRLSRRGKAPKKITSSTFSQYAAAITDLFKTQVKKKINSHPHPRTIIQDLLKVQKDQDYQRKRENFEDRGEGTLADGYTTMDQVAEVVKYFLDQGRNHGSNLRASAAFLFSHYFLLRSQSIVNAELTDIQTVKLENEGISPETECPALVLILRRGKTNKNNRLELGGCMRSSRVEVCPIMALGFYLFWRYHMENETFPNFTMSKDWYSTKLFRSEDLDSSSGWNYNSHRDAIARGLNGANVVSKSKTHVLYFEKLRHKTTTGSSS